MLPHVYICIYIYIYPALWSFGAPSRGGRGIPETGLIYVYIYMLYIYIYISEPIIPTIWHLGVILSSPICWDSGKYGKCLNQPRNGCISECEPTLCWLLATWHMFSWLSCSNSPVLRLLIAWDRGTSSDCTISKGRGFMGSQMNLKQTKHCGDLTHITGWWFQPLRKLLVSWDDFSQCIEKQNVQNHQPVLFISHLVNQLVTGQSDVNHH